MAVGLKISQVIHKASIDVGEKDTEAVAATVVDMPPEVQTVAWPPPPPPVVFRADHPFLFALVDNRTDMILFMGRYVAPPPAP